MRNKNQQGFTLIELLVVIAIIGLLASVVLLALNSARQKSRDAKRVADIRQIQSGLELYFNDCNAYPATAALTGASPANNIGGGKLMQGTASAGTCSGGGFVTQATATVGSVYIQQLPFAPTPLDGTSLGSFPCTATNAAYAYTSASPFATYALTFCLGAATGGLTAGAHTASDGGINQP